MRNSPTGNSLLVACLVGILAVPVCASTETVGQFPFVSGKRIEKTRIFTADFERTWDAILSSIEQDHRAWKKLEGRLTNRKWDVYADKNARLIVIHARYEGGKSEPRALYMTYTFIVEPIDPDHTRVHCHNVSRNRNVPPGVVGGPYFRIGTPAYFDMAEKALKERQGAR